MPRCLASTARGNRCRLKACVGKEACHMHHSINSDSLMLDCASKKHDIGKVIDVCSICLEDMYEKERGKPLATLDSDGACGHTFHKKCLESWFSSNNLSCPNCRHNVNVNDFSKAFSTRKANAFMIRVRFALAQLKAACKKRGRSLIHLGIDEQALIAQMQLVNMICVKHVAEERLQGMEKRIQEFASGMSG